MEFNLADLYESVADRVPEREAVVWGSTRLTFRQLDERRRASRTVCRPWVLVRRAMWGY